MRIRTLLLACIGVVGCLAVWAATLRAVDAGAEREAVLRAESGIAGLQVLLRLSEQVAAERGAVTTLFTRPEVLRDEGLPSMDAAQEQSNTAWEMATAVVPGDKGLVDSFHSLQEARSSVRVSLMRPQHPDSTGSAQRFVAAVSDLQVAANLAADGLEREVGRSHAGLGRLAGIARLSQSMREAAGLRSNQLSLALAGVNRTEELFRGMDELRGRIAALWDRTVLAIAQAPHNDALLVARDHAAATLLSEGEAIYRATNDALRDGLPLPMPLKEFRAWTVPMLANGVLVRDAAFANAREEAASLRADADLRLRLAVMAAAAAAATALGAALVVLRRVALPLAALTSAMVRLARGDAQAAVPGVTRRDELGAMARAVEVFKASENKISWMAQHDGLTRLPNRSRLRHRLEGALCGVEPVSLLFLDLDRFKEVNDTLGHVAGDVLLQRVAQRLLSCVRDGDMVARLGGDEFAVLVMGGSPEDAGQLAGRLVAALSQPFDLGGQQVAIGASIGIAAAGPGQDADTLVRNADQALYQAKGDGRGTHRFFAPEMDQRLQRKRTLEAELRDAVAAEAFTLHYQPIVNLLSGRIVGMEALLRWRHPVHGEVCPAEFIPIAEETGLIRPLGAWALQQACQAAATWPAGVRLAVNLSAVQFQGGCLLAAVSEALAVAGFPAGQLELEVTESVLLRQDEATLAQLRRLRALGARVCLDDFGVGYASLSSLHGFPFDKIKIDQSFIRDLPGRDSARAIVRAIAGLGATLAMATTAEGVETAAQLEAVRAYGCTEAQGSLFSRPRPAHELAAVFASAPPSRTPEGVAAWASP